MRFEMAFDCDNDAFGDEPKWEVARILREIAAKIEEMDEVGDLGHNVRDINGNTVGQFIMVEPRAKA